MTNINPKAEKISTKPVRKAVVDSRNLKTVLEYIKTYK